ncbi:MAG: PaaI family thioesterase [Candidatus Poribacteria bacterium]|nr:PaaI family thioesterase [Candidatus Poribacteria bacterium]
MRVGNNNRCFACGQGNPFGLQVHPDIAPDGSQVIIECTPPDHFQGWADVVHGGILSTLLDEAITYVGIASFDSPAVTVQLEVRFKKPAHTGDRLIVAANRIKMTKRLITAEAYIELEDGTRIAEGSGKVMRAAGVF